VLFFFSGQSAVTSGELSLSLVDRVLVLFPGIDMEPLELEHVLRKLAHFAIFAVEGMLVFAALNTFRSGVLGNFVIAVAVCAAVGGLNELHQMFSEGRSCQFTDVLIDAAGGLAGASAGAAAVWFMHKLDRWRRV